MRITSIIMLALGLITSCGQPQSNDRKLLDDIVSYLPEGSHQVEILELIKSKRSNELGQKLNEAVQKNWNWFIEEQKKAEVLDQSIPYDERLGLTKKEYEEFLKILEKGDKQYVKTGTGTVTINYSDHKVTFQSTGQLEIFNKLTIDLNDLVVTVGEYKLSQVDTINVTKDNNAFDSSWKGYYCHNNTLNQDTTKSNSNLRPLSLTIGKLTKNNKTFVGLLMVETSYVGPIDRKFNFML